VLATDAGVFDAAAVGCAGCAAAVAGCASVAADCALAVMTTAAHPKTQAPTNKAWQRFACRE